MEKRKNKIDPNQFLQLCDVIFNGSKLSSKLTILEIISVCSDPSDLVKVQVCTWLQNDLG